ncbi:hypothetical protein DPF_1761 [Desulfoplanes formicivorans]|uniref:Uncharacterized protein n=1 Tax=Desulfoplanes formicivorans TaxID=1592317 RepID=A0A194AIZ6_9BACT|nr:hypothetical protein DPF_1761 [Desulfoplanes formicivorans]
MNKNNLLARSVPVGHNFKRICRTGINTHGTPIASITVYVDDLILGYIRKHIIIDNKFHVISPSL